MMRVAGILLIFLCGYLALFLGLVWGVDITSGFEAYTPEVVVNSVSTTAHLIAQFAPACVCGAIIGYCLAFYRGGSMKWLAIIIGVLAVLLLLYSLVFDIRSAPVAFCIAFTLIGARKRKQTSSESFAGKFLGELSEEEKRDLQSQKRYIEYLARARKDAENALNIRLASDAIKELPGEIERHKEIFDGISARFEADKRLFDELTGDLTQKELPDYFEDWREHLYYGGLAVKGARTNLATARYLIDVLEKTTKKEKYSTAARLAHMIRAELSDMNGNLEFVKPFEKPKT